ncbi:MAG TPA: ABC transporter substrate-binding protein [Streptosporangiaceae bacterium]|nr:ABC transporter substrate-binding protein [Streptosporangiaceae bacterium]
MNGPMARRVVLAATAGLLVAACSSNSPSGNGSSNTAAHQGGMLAVGLTSFPPEKGNPFAGIGAPAEYVADAIFNPLTNVSANGTVVPELATSWKQVSADTWTFTMRQGVTFSDGEKFNAAAAAANFNYIRTVTSGKTSAVGLSFTYVASTKALNASTLQLTTTSPDPILPRQLGVVWIVAPNILKQGAAAIAAHPVGTGPFKVASWAQSKITLTAFAGSWQKPHLSQLVFDLLPDSAAQLQALLSGQIGLAPDVSPDQVPQLTGTTKALISKLPVIEALEFDTASKKPSPVDSQLVRQALNYAVDKQAIADKLLLGKVTPVGQGADKGTTGYNPAVTAYPYDPAKARQLLAKAGYPHGFSLSAQVIDGTFPADTEVFQAVAANLKAVGVNLTLDAVPFSIWLTNYLKASFPTQINELGWSNLPALDIQRAATYYSCLKIPAIFCNKAVVPLLNEAASTASLSKHTQLLQEVMQIDHDNPPAIFLTDMISIDGLSSKLQGMQDVNGMFTWNTAWLSS